MTAYVSKFLTHDDIRNWNEPVNVEINLRMDHDTASELGKQLMDKDYNVSDMFPGKVIVKCTHCGQWCARKTACVYCGAPVD